MCHVEMYQLNFKLFLDRKLYTYYVLFTLLKLEKGVVWTAAHVDRMDGFSRGTGKEARTKGEEKGGRNTQRTR